jgi:serine-type D-Ala-D-Ala carboxypeptidase
MARSGGLTGAETPALSDAIAARLRVEIERGEMPSAAWCVMHRGAVVCRGALGEAVIEPERVAATPDTIYDLASLTKPLVTTTMALVAASEGRIDLDHPVARQLPEIASSGGLAGATWEDLLAHRAGLEAWHPLYAEGNDRASYLRSVLARPPAYPPRTSVVYSDLGFVLLFLALERLWDEDFETLAKTRILDPIGASRCLFRPPAARRAEVAATERGNEKERAMVCERGLSFDGWREEMIWGEVNDCNAWFIGGVCGHAGLFGDCEGVARIASIYLPGSEFLPDAVRAAAASCRAEGGGEKRGLGWQLRSGPSSPGWPLSAASFGHAGFTGTSVWVDPEAELVIALLTNRIHPRVRESGIQQIRRVVNEIVAARYL